MGEIVTKSEYRETAERLPAGAEWGEAEERTDQVRQIAQLRLIWERRRFLFRVTGAGVLISILAAFLIPTRYTSSTRLMPPDNQSNQGLAMLTALAGKASGLASMAGDLIGIKNTGDLFIGVLQSRSVQDALIEKFGLLKVYSDKKMEDARMDLAEHTGLSSDRKSGIITIQVTDHNPERAAALAREYVAQLNRVVTEVNTSSAHRERIFLEDRLKSVMTDLEDAEKQFGQFSSKNTTLDLKEQAKAMVEAGAALQGQLIAVQSQLESLKQIYTENNVRVRAAEARAASLRHELEIIGGKNLELGAEQSGTTGDSLYPPIRKLPLIGVEYADLYRRTKVQEAIYETLTQEYELAKVQEAKETPTVKVLDPADVPQKRSFPPRLLIIVVCFFLSVGFASTWVLGRAQWEKRDRQAPGVVLTEEVLASFQSAVQRVSVNGYGWHSLVDWVRRNPKS